MTPRLIRGDLIQPINSRTGHFPGDLMTPVRVICFAAVISAFLLAQSNPAGHSHGLTTVTAAPSPANTGQRSSPEVSTPILQHPVVYASGGTAAMSAIVADVNGDGEPDVIVANQIGSGNGDGTVGVLLGRGNGTFLPTIAYDSGGPHAWAVAVADVNGDSKPDILVANANGSNTVGVLLNKGDGTFSPAVTYKGGGYSIAVADLNGDGYPDLVTGAGKVLLGNGDGTFQPAVPYVSLANYAALADVNGDGKLDMIALLGGGGVAVLLGNGDGSFQTAVTYPTGGVQSYSVAVADVNGDGKPDIAVSNYCTTGDCIGDGSAAVLLGNGNGTFQPATTYDSGARFAQAVALADVDGDGRLDLLVGNYCQPLKTPCGSHGSISLFLGLGNGTFAPAITFLTPNPVGSLAVADINGGKPDVVAASESSSVMALFGERVTAAINLAAAPDPSSVNQPVTFTATIIPSAGQDLGGETVGFYDRTTAIGYATTVAGVAKLTTPFATAGRHPIKAKFSKDAAFYASVGKTTQVVNPQ